jgi:predicted small metal-binding protein
MKELATRWDLRILKGDNGFRCNWLEDLDEEQSEARIMETVFEEAESEHGEIEAFQRLLWFVTEHFGMVGSKHDAKRIRIEIDNGEAD